MANAATAAAKRKSLMCVSPLNRSNVKRTAAGAKSALCHIHHALAEAVHGEYATVTHGDGERWNDAAGDDHHAGFQIALALGEQVREPCQRRERVFRLPLADGLAVERLSPGEANDVVRRNRFR